MNPNELRALVGRIKTGIDISEVIGAHIELNRSLKGICPFHPDSDPSFSVNKREQYFHCFGCGVGGDAIKFLMLYERIGFVEALTELAELAGIEIPRNLKRR